MLENLLCRSKIRHGVIGCLGLIVLCSGCGTEHVPSEDELRAVKALRAFGAQVTVKNHRHTEVYLTGTKITDGDLYHLRALPDIQLLNLQSTGITDAGMEQVGQLKTLKRLTLQRSKVTDAGLAFLSGLTSLVELDLAGLPITDAGLEHLHGLVNIEKIYFDRARTTQEGVYSLEDSLPKAKVFAD